MVHVAAESSDNWEVLLPLRRLRHLTLPERAVHDRLALRTLSNMPWVPHVHYCGRTCGERAHDSRQPWRVQPWLHQLGRGPLDFAPADDDKDDDAANEDNVDDDDNDDDEGNDSDEVSSTQPEKGWCSRLRRIRRNSVSIFHLHVVLT